MVIVYNCKLFKLPWFNNFSAMVLGKYMFTRYSKQTLPYEVYFHETVHQEQMKWDGYIKFYTKYASEYVVNLFKYRDFMQAYLNISYEKEAYAKTRVKMKETIDAIIG